MSLSSRSASRSLVIALVLAASLVLSLLGLGGCGSAESGATTSAPAATETSAPAATPSTSVSSSEVQAGATTGSSDAPAVSTGGGDRVLEVVGPTGTRSYTLEEMKALKTIEGYGGMKSSTGRITPPTLVKGVLLEDLLAEVGGAPADMAVNIVAKDGYEMTVSVDQLKKGAFLTYDMVTGKEKALDQSLQVIVAYEVDGKPIDPEGEGPLRLGIVSAEQNQVTDGHWWVKWVTKLQVKPVEQEWSLLLSGALTEEMDRATFGTGATCHGQEWTDAEGNTWTGIPLYLLVGRIDDENVHEGPAYNRDLANAGYDVEIVTSGTGTLKVSSKTMYYKKDLIVASRLNGKELPEEYWPLRLVGEGLEPSQMVGGIGEIKALLPPK